MTKPPTLTPRPAPQTEHEQNASTKQTNLAATSIFPRGTVLVAMSRTNRVSRGPGVPKLMGFVPTTPGGLLRG